MSSTRILAAQIERYLAAVSKIYAREGERDLQQIIVNAQIHVIEDWTSDNWNGGTFGHAIYLRIPEELFLPIASNRGTIQERIVRDLNNVHNFQNEHVAEVFLELEIDSETDWRADSGLLLAPRRSVTREAAQRVWADGFRLFLSHKTEVKQETSLLRGRLAVFGISAFVAHEDIHPTKEWQDEIENALATMDGFVALITEKFHDSNWTDQEVGYALARAVPMIAVRLGRDPYGFLGKFQALTTTWDQAAIEIVKILIGHDRMLAAYIDSLSKCISFENGNILSSVLPAIPRITSQQADLIVSSYNKNSELRGSYGFNGDRPFNWGGGLVTHLHRWGFPKAEMVPGKKIHIESMSLVPQMDDDIPF